MRKNTTKTFIISMLVFISLSLNAAERTLKVYHDADYSNHSSSALSMMMGLNTVLAEVGHELQGYKIEVVPKNHRGNSVRSKQHMKEFINDPDALLMFGGLHSSPYIRYRDYINENGVLLLVPWAAGGPITRYEKGMNWVFRLSIDDTKAGYRIVQYAHDKKQCKSPHLLLEDTPWGKSNFNTMSKALEKYSDVAPAVTWFDWNIKVNSARILLRKIYESESDCILFVGNSIEGTEISNAVISLDKSERLPIISHWGITGGDFEQQLPPDARAQLDLSFVQTCFSFLHEEQTDLQNLVFESAKKLYPEKINSRGDIQSPPGFIHSYDLGKLLIEAVAAIQLSGNMADDRLLIRESLEKIKKPVLGLIKTYTAPFDKWSQGNSDAHEALSLEDFCMARFDDNNNVLVYEN